MISPIPKRRKVLTYKLINLIHLLRLSSPLFISSLLHASELCGMSNLFPHDHILKPRSLGSQLRAHFMHFISLLRSNYLHPPRPPNVFVLLFICLIFHLKATATGSHGMHFFQGASRCTYTYHISTSPNPSYGSLNCKVSETVR